MSTTTSLTFFASGFMPSALGIETPKTLWRLPAWVAAIAPATPASAAPEATRGTFALRTSGGTPLALRLTESATPFDAAAALLALALVRDPLALAPFDFGLDDRDPRALELDRRVLDLDFVWATMTFLSSPAAKTLLPPEEGQLPVVRGDNQSQLGRCADNQSAARSATRPNAPGSSKRWVALATTATACSQRSVLSEGEAVGARPRDDRERPGPAELVRGISPGLARKAGLSPAFRVPTSSMCARS